MHSRRCVIFFLALLLLDACGGRNEGSGATGATPSPTTGAATIALSAAAYSVAQNAGAVAITVNRTGGSAGSATVAYTTTNGSAHASADFTTQQGQITWVNGDSSPKTVLIRISNATPFAGTKTLGFYIAHAQGALLAKSITSAVVTIQGAALGAVTLLWTPPTHDVYGASVKELSGFNIYYGKNPSALTSVIAVNNPAANNYVIRNLDAGTWYFGVKAYNSQADESRLSTVVNETI
jgi:hypothetical protein